MLRRQRAAVVETDAKLAAYVTDRLAEGWTPEQIAGRLRLGVERGLRAVCAETIYGWIYRAAQKTGRLWLFLTRHHARRRKRHGRASRDMIAEKIHISRRSDAADTRAAAGHWEADLVIRGGSVCLNTVRGVSKWIGRSFQAAAGIGVAALMYA